MLLCPWQAFTGKPRRFAQADDGWHIPSPGPQPSFIVGTDDRRQEGCSATDIKRTNALLGTQEGLDGVSDFRGDRRGCIVVEINRKSHDRTDSARVMIWNMTTLSAFGPVCRSLRNSRGREAIRASRASAKSRSRIPASPPAAAWRAAKKARSLASLLTLGLGWEVRRRGTTVWRHAALQDSDVLGRYYGFTASNEMLFTPNFLLAPRALSEMN